VNARPAEPLAFLLVDAFILSAPDNDSYMLAGAPEALRCGSCGRSLDSEWVDPSFRLSERGCDASYTYDGYLIVSARFREVVADRGARYVDIPAEPSCSVLIPVERVRFDAIRRRTTFENFCEACGRYHDVAGATPAFLRSVPPPDGLRATDLEFGSGDEQHPLLIVGARLADELREAQLQGVELKRVES
jgi:hypothetical protein